MKTQCILLVAAAMILAGCGQPFADSVPPTTDGPRVVQAEYYAPGYRSRGGGGGDQMWYVGAAVQPMVSHFADAEELESGPGFGIRAGFFADQLHDVGFDPLIALEISLEISDHDHEFFPTIDATFTRFLFGGRLVDPRFDMVRPFVSLGFGFYSLNFTGAVSGSDLAGFGGYSSAGIELMLTRNVSIEFGGQIHSWTDEDAVGDTLSLGAFQVNIGATLNY